MPVQHNKRQNDSVLLPSNRTRSASNQTDKSSSNFLTNENVMPHTTQPQFNHGGFEPHQTSTPVMTFAADTASTIGRMAMDISKLALFPVCCAALCKLLREAGIAVEAVQWVESMARGVDWTSIYSDCIVPLVLLVAMTSFIIHA